MASFPEVVRDSVRSALCSVLGPVESAASYLAPVTGGLGTNAAARGLRALSCGEPGPDDVPPPFTGGQCDGVLYDVEARGTNFFGNPNQLKDWNSVPGPISGLVFPFVSGNNYFIQLRYQGGAQANGSGPASTKAEFRSTWNITSVVRSDAQPDTCGNPPPLPVPPYVPAPVTFNITYEGDDNVTYNRDIDITLNVPIINISGELEIPVDIALSPDFNLRGRIGLNPDFNISLSPGGLTDRPTEIPQPPDDEGEQFIKGAVAILDCGVASRATQLYRPPGPDLCVPRIATVVFLVGVGGSSYWTTPVDIKTEVSVTHVPGGLLARNYRVSPEPGVTVISSGAFA